MREKLIELQKTCCVPGKKCALDCLKCMADHLLANGVIVLPCKVGDTVYDISEFVDGTDHPEMYELRDDEITVGNGDWFVYGSCFIRHEDFGKTVFLTREEAEAALKEGQG